MSKKFCHTEVMEKFCKAMTSGLLMALVFSCTVLAADGNVKGKVVDLKTGEPLIGANILVVGSARGAVANEKGQYFVSGVPPGVYVIRASFVGYQTIETKNVEISSNQTFVLDFKLASSDVQVEGVTVVGQAPLVDVMKTAGDQTFDREKIEQIPNVKGVKDVVSLQAGVVQFGGQLFLRGGRANETQIMIDGVPVNDVGGRVGTAGTSTTNEQLQQLYSGNQTAGAGGALSVSANAIQSVNVSSSGLDAEYGNAQSGVVNIITKGGGESYNGSLLYRTDGLTSATYNERYYALNFGGPEPVTSYLLPSVGADVPGKLSFFMSGTFEQSDGPYSFNTTQFYSPIKRKIKFGGLFGKILSGMGMTYSEKQNNAFSFNSKFNYVPGDNDQLSFSYRANANSSHPLGGAYGWRDFSDSTISSISLVTQNVMQWTHVLGEKALVKGFVSRLVTSRKSSVGLLDPNQYSDVDINKRDPNSDGFIDLGTSQSWNSSNTVVWNMKFDYNAQVHPLHFLKTGAEYYAEQIKSTAISYPQVVDTTAHGQLGDAPGYGFARWVTDVEPSRGALYIQDNIELSSINLHIGLRYDYFYLGKEVFDTAFVNRWENVTQEKADWLGNKSFFSQFKRGNLSPRLSIGYPISTRTVFYFNYGHFLQYPDRDQFFHDPIATTLSNNYVGNPSLKPQRTIQYEAGFDQLIFDDLSLGIRGFYKDIFDYASLRRLPVKPTVDKYVNLDYASVRGFEIIITKQVSNNYQGSIRYSFQLAKGRASDPLAAQASPQLFGLPREVRLDYDQQHTLYMFIGYRVGPNEEYSVFGLPLNNWGASMTWSYGSGFPYTPVDLSIARGTLGAQYLQNTVDGPYTSEVNFSMYKGFNFFDKLNLILTLDITNLFNRRNVDINAGGFNTYTGAPTQFGDYDPDNKVVYPWSGVNGKGSFDARVPPFIFRSPRQIALGMKINWD